jgi:hypothetical protein
LENHSAQKAAQANHWVAEASRSAKPRTGEGDLTWNVVYGTLGSRHMDGRVEGKFQCMKNDMDHDLLCQRFKLRLPVLHIYKYIFDRHS